MTAGRGRDELERDELIALGALDALDPNDAADLAAALADDPTARQRLEEYRDVAAVLAEAVEGDLPTSPSPAVWDRISESISLAPSSPAPVIDLASRRWVLRVAASITVAAVIAIGVLGLRILEQDRRLDELSAQTADPLERAAREAAAEPGSVVATLAGDDGEPVQIAQVVFRSDGVGYLLGDTLASLPADRTYQLWAIVDGEVISAGVLGPDPGISPFRVVGSVEGFALTEEVAGGVVASANDPVGLWLAG